MSKGCAGIKILEKGTIWRKELLSGMSVQTIATRFKAAVVQIVSRTIWLAKIPLDIKIIIKENPEIFTSEILINQFGAKRNLCEKGSFKLLCSKITLMAKEGMGNKPKFPTLKNRKSPIIL